MVCEVLLGGSPRPEVFQPLSTIKIGSSGKIMLSSAMNWIDCITWASLFLNTKRSSLCLKQQDTKMRMKVLGTYGVPVVFLNRGGPDAELEMFPSCTRSMGDAGRASCCNPVVSMVLKSLLWEAFLIG